MAQSVKISDQKIEAVRRTVELSSQPVAGQVDQGMKSVRAVKPSPRLNHDRIRQTLAGERSPDALSGEEQTVFIDELLAAVSMKTPEQAAFFEKRRKEGLGVGVDESGEIVRQADIEDAGDLAAWRAQPCS